MLKIAFLYIKAQGTTINVSINKLPWVKLPNNHFLFWAGSFVCSSSGSLIQHIKQHFPWLYSCDWLFSPTEAGESVSCGGASSLFTAVCVLTRGRLLRRRRRGGHTEAWQGAGNRCQKWRRESALGKKKALSHTITHIHTFTHALTVWHLSSQSV